MLKKTNYHHGDLRSALIDAARMRLQKDGIDALSLRKISEQVGVSRMGAYHHFKNKHELLCAVAAQGFKHLQQLFENNFSVKKTNATQAKKLLSKNALKKNLRSFIRNYIDFSLAFPEQYELMFGRTLWKNAQATEELKTIAYTCFKQYTQHIEFLMSHTQKKNKKFLRVAQISWSTIHGLSHLFIDGIYINRSELDAIIEEILHTLLIVLSNNKTPIEL